MQQIEVVLVDDHRIFREGIRNLLEQQTDITVVGEAEDGRMAVKLIHTLSPTIVVMDITMPNLNGIDATRRILEVKPDTKILALSMHTHRCLVREMLKAGASGYLLKECAFNELVQAIRLIVEKKQICLSPEISRMVLDDYIQPGQKNGPDSRSLTPRERELVQLISEGNTNKHIANMLSMSVRTVEKHRLNIMGKLHLESVAELVKYAIREGLTNP
jgi:DNA-binding NarL/FixJ family response regulator